jgi:hypothetical protein
MDSFQAYLMQDRSYACVRGSRDLLQLDTPFCSAKAYGLTILETDVREKGYTDIAVLAGSVAADNENGMMTINSGEVLSIGEGFERQGVSSAGGRPVDGVECGQGQTSLCRIGKFPPRPPG